MRYYLLFETAFIIILCLFLFLGPLTVYTIHFLQHLREFFNMTFMLDNPQVADEDAEESLGSASDNLPGANKVLLACVGIGYVNMNKRTN